MAKNLLNETAQAPASEFQRQNEGDDAEMPLHAAVQDNNVSLLEDLLAAGIYVDGKDEAGTTPLVLALNSDQFDAAIVLLDHEADVYAVDPISNMTVLEMMFNRSSSLPPAIVARAVHALRDSDLKPNEKAVLLARADCHLEIVTYFRSIEVTRTFLELKPITDIKEIEAALKHTMINGDSDTVRAILNKGIKWTMLAAVVFFHIAVELASSRSSVYNSLALRYLEKLESWKLVNEDTLEFFRAAFNNSSENCVRTLANSNVNLPFRKKYGEDLLAHVFGNTNFCAVLVMFNRDFDVDARGAAGCTGLHFSVMANSPDNVRFLLDRGANIELENNSHRTPLVEAILHSRHTLVMLLLQNGADITTVLLSETPCLDPFSSTFNLVLQEQIIGQMVLSEILGEPIEPELRYRIDRNKRCSEFYACFRLQISDMHRVRLVDSLTLYTAITGSFREIAPHLMHVDIGKLVQRVESRYKFHYYFVCTLKEQFRKAAKLNDIRRGYWSICPG